MIKLLRRIIFYLFLAVYLVVCPLLIMWSLGYVFSPRSQEVVQTGMIALETEPRDASVYLGRSRYIRRTPTVLRDLIPGSYTVRLFHKNYFPWEHTIVVEPGKAHTFDKILLVPWHRQATAFFGGPCKEFIPMEGTDFILISKGDLIEDFLVYDIAREKGWPLSPLYDLYRGARVVSCWSVPRSDILVLQVEWNRLRKFLLVKIREEKNSMADITPIMPDEPLAIVWDPGDEKHLFSLHKDGEVNRLDVSSKEFFPAYATGVRGLGVYDRQVYFVSAGNSLVKSNYDKNEPETVTAKAQLREALSSLKGPLQIHILPDDQAIIVDRRGNAVMNRSPYRMFDGDILGIRYDRDDKMLLVWQRDKAGVIDCSARTDDGGRRRRLAIRWVYETRTGIQQCFWVYGTSHILVRERDEVFLVELLPQGRPHVNSVAAVKRDAPVYYSESTGQFYYVDRSTGSLMSLEIMPRKRLIPAPFSGEEKNGDD